jgi:glycosyltransferase involved in cell wall biosynthesis
MLPLWERYPLPPAFVLTIASASRRKNLIGLLRVYGRLPESVRTRYPLVVVWTHAHLQRRAASEVDRLGLKRWVQFLSAVPDRDLVLLYNAATAFVFPSLYEGFGLPVLEAMACGTPVVATNLTSVPEVTGDAAKLVDPRDEDAFLAALTGILTDPEERARLSRAGLERARQFSWERAAQQTLDLYRDVRATR